jgi:hypothetical protein
VARVKSANSDVLTGLGDRPGADMTARLLLALTALYVQRPTHTVEEQQRYMELALRLIDKVEAATRAAVARILQRHPDAPAEVVARLGGLPHSTQDQHSTGNQLSGGNRRLADAQRTSTLAPSRTTPSMQQLAPTTCEIGEAFLAASPAERRGLLSLIARGCGDDVQAAPEHGERIYERVDIAASHGRIGEFTREFERLIDIPNSLCERILNDPSGEPMVIAARATGIPIAILQRILLLVSPAVSHSVQRVYELTELYHSLDRGTARDLLARWRAQAKPNYPVPETGHAGGNRKPGALREASVASLGLRFGALTERLQGRTVNARPDRGSVARRGLQSR